MKDSPSKISPEVISSFSGRYRPFSNFYKAEVWPDWWPQTLPSFPGNEWLYQAWKSDPEQSPDRWIKEVELIRSSETAREAKFLGGSIPLRDDWEEIKIAVMRYCVQLKFRNHPDLRQLLLDTEDADLIEGNTWGDRFWGATWDKDFGWTGLNWLGTLLMEEREALRE